MQERREEYSGGRSEQTTRYVRFGKEEQRETRYVVGWREYVVYMYNWGGNMQTGWVFSRERELELEPGKEKKPCGSVRSAN